MKSEDLHFFEVRSIIFLQYVLMYYHLELESYILIVHLSWNDIVSLNFYITSK